MKFIFLVLLISFYSCNENQKGKQHPISKKETFSPKKINSNIKGEWNWEFNDNSQIFSLNLNQNTDSVWGSHCCVTQGGDKIDCAEDNELTIHGKFIDNDKVQINFKSTFANIYGKAAITILSPDTIRWKIIEFKSDDLYIPKEANLIKNK